jgi:GMP synthase-like glutamine amidotransferase
MEISVYDCVKGDKLTQKYGPVSETVIRWIAPHLPEGSFKGVHVADNAPLPSPGETEGIIISGSEKGVYDTPAWMEPLRKNLQAHRAAGTPIFGICFGHQLMADVFGGKAEKVDLGFITGARRFEIEGAHTPAYVAHQDQVTAVPPQSKVTASASYCPVAALDYDFPAMSVQFHPEYDAAFTKDLIGMFGDMLMSKAEIEASLASIKGDVSRDLYAEKVASFFRAHAG